MAQGIDLKILDKRTAERYIARGLLDEREWAKHLSSLEDALPKGTSVETSMAGDAEINEEDDREADDQR
jgi:hypothetical protein